MRRTALRSSVLAAILGFISNASLEHDGGALLAAGKRPAAESGAMVSLVLRDVPPVCAGDLRCHAMASEGEAEPELQAPRRVRQVRAGDGLLVLQARLVRDV